MQRLRPIVFALSVALGAPVVVGFPAPAVAQQRDMEKAKEAYKAGKSAYDSGDFLTAAEKFVESYEFSGRDELLFNIGQAYRQGGKLVEAEKYFQQYLQVKPDAANADDVVNYVIEIQQQIAAEYGTVEFKGKGAVSLKDGPNCNVPCTLTLRAGELSYTATAEGFEPLSGKVKVEPSKTATISLDFKPVVVNGYVRLESDRPASVKIDGAALGSLPLDQPIALSPGRHTMELVDGSARWKGEVDVEANETLRMMVPLDASGGTSWKRVGAFVLGGSGVAFAVGGALMGLEASSTYDTLDRQTQKRGYADQDLVDQGSNQALMANVLYIASAVAIGSGIGLFVWDTMGQGEDDVAAPSEDGDLDAQPIEAPAEEPTKTPEKAAEPQDDGDEDLLL